MLLAGSQLEYRLMGNPSANFLRVGLYYGLFRRMFGNISAHREMRQGRAFL
jgi:hypothetical protein